MDATAPLPTIRLEVDRAVSSQFAGAILRQSAVTLGLPVSAPVKYISVGVTNAQTGQAVTAAIAAGYDGDFVHYFVAPPPPVLPPATLLFFAALAVGGFAVLLLVASQQAHLLHEYRIRLHAIGLGARIGRAVLNLQVLTIAGTGIVVGTLAGLAGLWVAASQCSAVVVPAAIVLGVDAALLIGAVLATMLASRSAATGSASTL